MMTSRTMVLAARRVMCSAFTYHAGAGLTAECRTKQHGVRVKAVWVHGSNIAWRKGLSSEFKRWGNVPCVASDGGSRTLGTREVNDEIERLGLKQAGGYGSYSPEVGRSRKGCTLEQHEENQK